MILQRPKRSAKLIRSPLLRNGMPAWWIDLAIHAHQLLGKHARGLAGVEVFAGCGAVKAGLEEFCGPTASFDIDHHAHEDILTTDGIIQVLQHLLCTIIGGICWLGVP